MPKPSPPRIRTLNYSFDRQPDGSAAGFTGTSPSPEQAAALVGELRDLTDRIDIAHPPWADPRDLVRSGLYRRNVPGYGTIWFTLLQTATPDQPLLVVLAGTIEANYNADREVRVERESYARGRVEHFEEAGRLYVGG